MRLPGPHILLQVALIQAVSAVQPRTVVVLNNGSAVTMTPWLDNTAAVLEGEEMVVIGKRAVTIIDGQDYHKTTSGREFLANRAKQQPDDSRWGWWDSAKPAVDWTKPKQ